MKVETLVRMANEIARNLRSLPGDEPRVATAEHVRSFWTPGMRASIMAHAEAGGAGLDPIARDAVRLLGAPAGAG
ncbi:MAG: formate dehydrogenase subunit delta [Gemmatimonadaceae bacterium]|nr:formate dehydrogenase subunit delta [Gemmatimonadaceae bacterium]